MPSSGGKPKALTTATRGVQQIVWSPDSRTIAFATQDEPEKKPGLERFNQSFEVTPNTNIHDDGGVPPTHLWIVRGGGGEPKRLTSGPAVAADQPPAGAAGVRDSSGRKGSDFDHVFRRGGGQDGRVPAAAARRSSTSRRHDSALTGVARHASADRAGRRRDRSR